MLLYLTSLIKNELKNAPYLNDVLIVEEGGGLTCRIILMLKGNDVEGSAAQVGQYIELRVFKELLTEIKELENCIATLRDCLIEERWI